MNDRTSKAPASAAQIRGARGLLGWSQDRLAQESKVSRSAIVAIENGKRVSYDRTLYDLIRTFEDAGISFHSTIEDVPPGATTSGGLAHDDGFTDYSESVSLRWHRQYRDDQ
jgi:DNA-binding XRE family transcriptional regulator